MMSENYAQESSTSQGDHLSSAKHLDSHFALAQPEYETLLKAVGLQAGWHVLDAGCGVGSFLPLMSELVGENGRITAIDLAPENIEVVQTQIAPFVTCPLETKVSSILELPFADDTFDALWCANVIEYLSDNELHIALAEFQRVVRPDGLVAIKEFDRTMLLFWPHGIRLMWRLNEAVLQSGDAYHLQVVRNYELATWLKQAGFANVRHQSILIERPAPLKTHELPFLQGGLPWLAQTAVAVDLPEEDKALWQRITDSESDEYILNHPDFVFREGALLFVGQVP